MAFTEIPSKEHHLMPNPEFSSGEEDSASMDPMTSNPTTDKQNDTSEYDNFSFSAPMSYEIFPWKRNPGATTDQLKFFYPERTVLFRSFHPHITAKSVWDFVRRFGSAVALKFWKYGDSYIIICVFETRASAIVAVLYFKNRDAHVLEDIIRYADFLCNMECYKFSELDEFFEIRAGEMASSNMFVTALVPKGENYEDIVRSLCVGEMREISLFPKDETHSVVRAEFEEPVDAALAVCVATFSEAIVFACYGNVPASKMTRCEITDTFKIEYSVFKDLAEVHERDGYVDVRLGIRTLFPFSTPQNFNPMETVVLDMGRRISRPLHFQLAQDLINVVHIQIPQPDGEKCVRTWHLRYGAYQDWIHGPRTWSFDSLGSEITRWVAYFSMDIIVQREPVFEIDIKLYDKNYEFAKSNKSFLQKDLRNFAFCYPSSIVDATESTLLKRVSQPDVSHSFSIERTENEELFINLPCVNDCPEILFSFFFIFHNPDNLLENKFR